MEDIARRIRELLSQRDPDKTICPSDVARSLREDNWRELMEPIRQKAAQLADAQIITITQHGEAVDPHDYSGPIRLRRGPRWDGQVK